MRKRKNYCSICRRTFFDDWLFLVHIRRHEKKKTGVLPIDVMTSSEQRRPALSKKDIQEIKKAWAEKDRRSNPEIKEYLRKNPSVGESGRFGMPQGKNRWGAYGVRMASPPPWAKRNPNRD